MLLGIRKMTMNNPPKSVLGYVIAGVGMAVDLACAVIGYVGAKKAQKIRNDEIDQIAEKTASKLASKMEADIKQMIDDEENERPVSE